MHKVLEDKMQYFTYLWIDRSRKMFYIGMHKGTTNDNYISSSRWFNGEYNYRSSDFRRKILKTFNDRASARTEEARLLAMIKESEYGFRYYNLKNGRSKGSTPWNAGKTGVYSQQTLEKMSNAKKGKTSSMKGQHTSHSSLNGKNGAIKLSKTVTGRRMAVRPDGTRYWVYPSTDCLGNKEQSANPRSITA